MKKYWTRLLLCLTTFLIISCQDMRSAIVLSDGSSLVFESDSTKQFDSFMDKNLNGKKVLVYITGRGLEPFRTKWLIAPYMEKHYDLQVVTFRWPSQGWVVGYPLENAIEARKPLHVFLHNFQEYAKRNNIRASLFVHSMGNIVLQNFLHDYRNSLDRNLFENIVLNAADIDYLDHEQMVNKIDFAKRIYVTFSSCDWVLKLSQVFKNGGRDRLGQLGYAFNSNSPATYIDFSKIAGYYHEYFRGTLPTQNSKVKRFFYEALRGETVSTYFFKKQKNNYYSLF